MLTPVELELGTASPVGLAVFDLLLAQHDWNEFQKLCAAYGWAWCTPKQDCKDKNTKDCQKASDWQLSQAGISDPQQFKRDHLGDRAPISKYDLCACKDGSIVIKQQGQCGSSGPSIDTGVKWK